MTYLPPFTLFSSRSAYEEKRIDRHITDWLKLLDALQNNRLDIARAAQQPVFNADLDSLILETGA